MNADLTVDPCETPVWALYTSNEGAEIICGTFVKYGQTKQRPDCVRMWSEGGKWTGRSSWSATKEALIEENGILPSCSGCGGPFSTKTWCDPLPRLLAERNLCFYCNHWLHDSLPNYGKPGVVVIDGHIYSYDPSRPRISGETRWLGHAGREFTIRLHSGETVTTNNLWHGGEIPTRFRSRFPDNASFIPNP